MFILGVNIIDIDHSGALGSGLGLGLSAVCHYIVVEIIIYEALSVKMLEHTLELTQRTIARLWL